MAPKRKTPCNTQDLPKPWSIWFHRSFYGCSHGICKVQARGSTWSYSYQPTAKPHQHQVQATLLLVAPRGPHPTEPGQGLNPHPPGHSFRFVTNWATMGNPEIHIGIEHLYDKTKQGLLQCRHLLNSWMGRLNTEYGQIPTEVFFLIFFFLAHMDEIILKWIKKR